MKLLIIGGGSLGLLFAATFSRTPQADVTLVTRTAEQAERIQASGIRVSGMGSDLVASLRCIDFSAWKEEGREEADWIGLMLKQTHIDDQLIEVLKENMARHPQAKLLCFQNGAGHLERFMASGIPEERLFAAVTSAGARREAANHVTFTGRGVTSIGCAAGGGKKKQLEEIQQLFHAAGFDCVLEERIQEAMYRKLLVNSIINPLTAILNVSNGELLQSEHTLKLMRELFEEACEVLKEAGCSMSEADWERVFAVCEKTAQNASSMLQDIRAGKRTEIDFINGQIVSLAAATGKRAPAHEMLCLLVKSLEAQASKRTISGAGEAR